MFGYLSTDVTGAIKHLEILQTGNIAWWLKYFSPSPPPSSFLFLEDSETTEVDEQMKERNLASISSRWLSESTIK